MSHLFLPIDGSTGRSQKSLKFLKNQHVQRYARKSTGNAGAPSSQAVQLTVRRCHVCLKQIPVANIQQHQRMCKDKGVVKIGDIATYMSYLGSEDNAMAGSLHHYCNFVMNSLSSHLSGQMWDKLVLQHCQEEAVVRQVVVVLSNGHRDQHEAGLVTMKTYNLYQKALQSLQTYMTATSNPSAGIIALCCVLLFTFEKVRGDAQAAQVHLDSGMKIISAAAGKNNTRRRAKLAALEQNDVYRDLRLILMVLDVETVWENLHRGLIMQPDTGLMVSWPPGKAPHLRFSSHDDVREAWIRLFHDFIRFISSRIPYRKTSANEVPPAIRREWQHLQILSNEWRRATTELRQRDLTPTIDTILISATNNIQQLTTALFDCIIDQHHLCSHALLQESLLSGPPPLLHPFDDRAEVVLTLAEKSTRLAGALKRIHHGGRKVALPLSHASKNTAPLLVAHRTRCPIMRARAIKIAREIMEVESGCEVLWPWSLVLDEPMVGELVFEPPGH